MQVDGGLQVLTDIRHKSFRDRVLRFLHSDPHSTTQLQTLKAKLQSKSPKHKCFGLVAKDSSIQSWTIC